MTDHELADELLRRADVRRGDSICSLLHAAAETIKRLLKAKGRARSTPQHRRYFGMIRAAHRHWPESHPVQPLTEEGLREYLQVRVGHGKPHRIEKDGQVYIWLENQSIAYNKMSQDDFARLHDAVEAIIVETIGTDVETLLTEDRQAA